jgi:hypothetical protein
LFRGSLCIHSFALTGQDTGTSISVPRLISYSGTTNQEFSCSQERCFCD